MEAEKLQIIGISFCCGALFMTFVWGVYEYFADVRRNKQYKAQIDQNAKEVTRLYEIIDDYKQLQDEKNDLINEQSNMLDGLVSNYMISKKRYN